MTLIGCLLGVHAFAGDGHLCDKWEGGKVYTNRDCSYYAVPEDQRTGSRDPRIASDQSRSRPSNAPRSDDARNRPVISGLENIGSADRNRTTSEQMRSGTATTQAGGYIACKTEANFDRIVRFIAANDSASIESYLNRHLCVSLRSGLRVTITEWPGMFGGRVKFAYQGYEFWTFREALGI